MINKEKQIKLKEGLQAIVDEGQGVEILKYDLAERIYVEMCAKYETVTTRTAGAAFNAAEDFIHQLYHEVVVKQKEETND